MSGGTGSVPAGNDRHSSYIDDLMYNLGDRDDTAVRLIPSIDRDPLLQGLAQFAQEMRSVPATAANPGLRMRP